MDYDPADVEEAAREDWASDSQGRDQMTREMYMDAVFECVFRRVRSS